MNSTSIVLVRSLRSLTSSFVSLARMALISPFLETKGSVLEKFAALRLELEKEIGVPVTVTVRTFGGAETVFKSEYATKPHPILVYGAVEGYTSIEGSYASIDDLRFVILHRRGEGFYEKMMYLSDVDMYVGKCPECKSYGLDRGSPNYVDLGMCQRKECRVSKEEYVTDDGRKGVKIASKEPYSKWTGLHISNNGDIYTTPNVIASWDIKAKWKYLME